MTAPPATPQFRIATPADWFDLDLDSDDPDDLVELVAARSALTREQAAEAGELLEVLAAARAQAVSHGAVFASMLSREVEGEPVSATLLVALRREPGYAAAAGADALARRLRRTPSSGPRAVDVVELAAGPSVRTRGRTPARPAGPSGPTIEVDTVQWFVPVPEGDALLVLTFSTPNLALADVFAELFDAMAATVAWEG